ncbi:16791_t:CDS:2 [Acaulospora colombiana]|uniref:16791_t:CDS:1 n=1 Tax=Acaulospora colombiana TaxID=27376 RepID=A0ACA9LCL8_9GLOM|nr:16791_t:CDS:2 [Acaulospora colombiana]
MLFSHVEEYVLLVDVAKDAVEELAKVEDYYLKHRQGYVLPDGIEELTIVVPGAITVYPGGTRPVTVVVNTVEKLLGPKTVTVLDFK